MIEDDVLPNVLREADHVILTVNDEQRPDDVGDPEHGVAVLVVILYRVEPGQSDVSLHKLLDSVGLLTAGQGLGGGALEYLRVAGQEPSLHGAEDVGVHGREEFAQSAECLADVVCRAEGAGRLHWSPLPLLLTRHVR